MMVYLAPLVHWCFVYNCPQYATFDLRQGGLSLGQFCRPHGEQRLAEIGQREAGQCFCNGAMSGGLALSHPRGLPGCRHEIKKEDR